MKFDEALDLMKKGIPMKLPSWGGYWTWDGEKNTIIMHCRPGNSDTGNPDMDIRETQRVEYTLRNITSDEWVQATDKNCTLMGGEPLFDFGTAIKCLKRGLKVKRKGWNGKDQYIELAKEISYRNPEGWMSGVVHEDIGSQAIAFVGTRGRQIGWLASQSDMLADDWCFA